MVRTLIHAFSIELKSKEFTRNVTVKDDVAKVLIDGYFGELKAVLLQENSMIEARGNNGVIKMDLTDKDLSALLGKRPHMKTQYE